MNQLASSISTALLLLASTALSTSSAWAALPIELEIAVEHGGPPTAMQDWARVLGDADLLRLRIRGANRGDQPEIETLEFGKTKRYRVVGLLASNEVLHLPGGKFRLRDKAKLKEFLRDLPVEMEHNAVDRGRFGLTEAQFRLIHAAMSRPVVAETKGRPTAKVFAALTAEFPAPLVIDPRDEAALAKAKPLTQELSALTTGTALAVLLRRSNLMFVPEQPRGGELQIRVADYDAQLQHWPVGWKPAGAPRQAAPKLYEFKTIEIDGYTLADALAALEPHLGTPLVFDELVLAREKKDALVRLVSLKRGKTYLRRAVDVILSQARLAGEVRVDEAGQAFYWITKFGKDSPRATQ